VSEYVAVTTNGDASLDSHAVHVVAPAKLTLSLEVTGVQPDGFHTLRAEMVSLNLCDELTISEGGEGVTFVASPGTRAEGLSSEDNLVTRALVAVGRRARVHVVKRIPLGGGLGGGSTDAAAVLRWAGCADAAVARRLGSDVPFSLVGGRAVVEGTGERVTPLAFEPRSFLLLVPPFGVNTARVYEAFDQMAGAGAAGASGNALAVPALAVEPRLARWRDALADVTGVIPRLAGSGSTWFVEIDGEGEEVEAPEWLAVDNDRARIVRARTVPADWAGE
jgi:4-diphosphocytidyl-2-C-methyl-D-erythritol kinase